MKMGNENIMSTYALLLSQFHQKMNILHFVPNSGKWPNGVNFGQNRKIALFARNSFSEPKSLFPRRNQFLAQKVNFDAICVLKQKCTLALGIILVMVAHQE